MNFVMKNNKATHVELTQRDREKLKVIVSGLKQAGVNLTNLYRISQGGLGAGSILNTCARLYSTRFPDNQRFSLVVVNTFLSIFPEGTTLKKLLAMKAEDLPGLVVPLLAKSAAYNPTVEEIRHSKEYVRIPGRQTRKRRATPAVVTQVKEVVADAVAEVEAKGNEIELTATKHVFDVENVVVKYGKLDIKIQLMDLPKLQVEKGRVVLDLTKGYFK